MLEIKCLSIAAVLITVDIIFWLLSRTKKLADKLNNASFMTERKEHRAKRIIEGRIIRQKRRGSNLTFYRN